LGKYAALIPLPVLAGILVTVGLGIIDYQGLRLLPNLPHADRLVFLVVLGLTVFVDLITAVQMGFLVAALLFFKNLSSRELTRSGALTPMVQADKPGARALADRVQVIKAEGPIIFGTSESFIDAFGEIGPDVKAVILRMSLVPLIDQTGAYALQEFILRMGLRGTTVVISGLAEEPANVLRKLGVIPKTISEDSVFPTLAKAVEGLNAKLGTGPDSRLRPQPYLPKVGG
ncbi:MAG TPA: STAS domain-containing protein, partial [Blastocatellia bacterium]